MLYLMVGMLLFGAVLVWLLAVVSFNAWRSRRLMDHVLAPYLLARGLCLQTFQGHVWRRRRRIVRPRPGQVLPLGSLVVLADGPATVSGACRGTGLFDGLGEDGLVVRLVGQYVQPPGQATGPWYAGRICSVGGAARGPGVVPGGDAPLPEVGVGHTPDPDPDLVTFTQDQVSLLAWKGPDNPVARLLRARRVRGLSRGHRWEDPVRRRTQPTPHWHARSPAWWRYEAIGYLPDRFTRVYWDRVRNQPLKAPMNYRTPEAREYNRQHYAAPIYVTALIISILMVAFEIDNARRSSRPHPPLHASEALLGMPPLASEFFCCILGLALGIGIWIWATRRQFPPHLMTPASSRELQTALDNFNIGMRYITGTTIPYTIHVLAYTALVLLMAYPFMDGFFIHGIDNLPDWFNTYLLWPTFILAQIGLIISTIDAIYSGWIVHCLDRELAE